MNDSEILARAEQIRSVIGPLDGRTDYARVSGQWPHLNNSQVWEVIELLRKAEKLQPAELDWDSLV